MNLQTTCDLAKAAMAMKSVAYPDLFDTIRLQEPLVRPHCGAKESDRQNFPEAAYRDVNDRLAILQDGKVYFRSMGNIATDTRFWEHKSVTNLHASDFDEWGTATGSPDFSSSGSPIRFGYIRGSSTNNPSGTRHTMSGTDNWNLTIHYTAVPEPALASILAAILIPFVCNRRRG